MGVRRIRAHVAFFLLAPRQLLLRLSCACAQKIGGNFPAKDFSEGLESLRLLALAPFLEHGLCMGLDLLGGTKHWQRLGLGTLVNED